MEELFVILATRSPNELRALAAQLSDQDVETPDELGILAKLGKSSMTCRRLLAQALRALADFSECDDTIAS